MIDELSVAVVMPALNEEGVIGPTLDTMPRDVVDVVWVADNGSSDDTAAEAAAHGAEVVREPRRGYGSACQAAIRALVETGPPDVVVFIDADGSQPVEQLSILLAPIAAGLADLVVGVRRFRDTGVHVALGNRLACGILHLLTGRRVGDLGPFRAIRFPALLGLELRDPDWGWNVQMQARALSHGLRVLEVPVAHHPRVRGRSKISGSPAGTIRAGSKILRTAIVEGWRARAARREGGRRPGGPRPEQTDRGSSSLSR